jgi:hypothetical protein
MFRRGHTVFNLLADRTLSQVKRVRGRSHAAVIRNGDEGPNEIEVKILGHWHIMDRNGSH